jgi:hypothetical protein
MKTSTGRLTGKVAVVTGAGSAFRSALPDRFCGQTRADRSG